MGYYNRWNYTKPSGYAEVWIDASRDGINVTVNATVKCTFLYSDDYIAYDGEINFNMWSGVSSASANIKGYSDRWYARNEWSRTRSCSMTFPWYGNDMVVGFNMTVPPGNSRFSISNNEAWLDVPDYIAPGAPTWINVNPNPCNINSAPLITWGGASVGSSGRLYYDVEVRSTRESGGWTDWLRISNAQGNTSYQEIVISGMNVYNQRPYVGVKYQYRIRSSDGSYTTSGWINTPELSISFGSPTPPTTYTFSDKSIKKDGSIDLSWSGATGGSSNISSYTVEYRIYNHKTSVWADWFPCYKGSSTKYTFDLNSFYNLKNGTYAIKVAANTNFGFDIYHSSLENSANLEIFTYSAQPNQQFEITYLNNGFYKIIAKHSGKSLDVAGGGLTSGTNVQQYTYDGNSAQQWIIKLNTDNSYSIISKVNNLCMDILNGVIKDDANVQMWTSNNSAAQKFNFVPIGEIENNLLIENGDLIQFRIKTINGWGQESTYLTTNSIPVRGNQMWMKINGSWKEGDTYLKVNNSWVEATPYIKVNGTWYETT